MLARLSQMRAFDTANERNQKNEDSLAEGVEFELSVDLARLNQSRKSVKKKSPFQDRRS
jgi:hypothetical protein